MGHAKLYAIFFGRTLLAQVRPRMHPLLDNLFSRKKTYSLKLFPWAWLLIIWVFLACVSIVDSQTNKKHDAY